MIASGEKKEEYREIKPYWMRQLMNCYTDGREECLQRGCAYVIPDKPVLQETPWTCFSTCHCYPCLYDSTVTFYLGYAKDRPSMTFKINRVAIGQGRPEWGAEEGKEYFVIKLGEKI